jgi:NAD+ synthase
MAGAAAARCTFIANCQRWPLLEFFVAVASGTPDEWRHIITRFLKDHVRSSGLGGVVIGISGGIDSSLTAALAVDALGAERVHGILMPCGSHRPEDVDAGLALVNHLGIEHKTIDIQPIVDGMATTGDWKAPIVAANIQARARMMVLYAEAQEQGHLVCGTGNKSELLVGYFTKHGDGGVDLEPIGDLYKTQVVELARHMGLPKALVERTPTAGLMEGQTDESELGMTYEALDAILKGIEMNASPGAIERRTGAPKERVEKVVQMVRRSEHKRQPPLIPKVGARTVGIDWRRSVHWDG